MNVNNTDFDDHIEKPPGKLGDPEWNDEEKLKTYHSPSRRSGKFLTITPKLLELSMLKIYNKDGDEMFFEEMLIQSLVNS